MNNNALNKLADMIAEQEGMIAFLSALVSSLILQQFPQFNTGFTTRPDGGLEKVEFENGVILSTAKQQLADLVVQPPDEYHPSRKREFLKGQASVKSHVFASIEKKVNHG